MSKLLSLIVVVCSLAFVYCDNNTLYCSSVALGFPICNDWTFTIKYAQLGIHTRRLLHSWDEFNGAYGHQDTYNFSIVPGTSSRPLPCDPLNRTCEYYPITAKHRTGYFCELIGLCSGMVGDAGLAFSPIPPTIVPPPEAADPDVYITHDQSGVKASYTFMSSPTCIVSRGSYSRVTPGNGTNCTIYYPEWAMSISAQVYFSIVQEGVIVFSDSWWEPGIAVCDLFGDIICCDRHNVTCMFLYSPMWWVGFVIAILILLMLACPLFLTLVVSIFWVIAFPITALFKLGWYLLGKIPWSRKPRTLKYQLSLLQLAAFPLLALACGSGGIISVPQESCVKTSPPNSAAYYTCQSVISTQVMLNYIGDSACFDITMQDAGAIGQLNVTLVEEQVFLTTKRDYYTGFWDMYTESSKRCYNAGQCTTVNCETLNSTTDYDAYGELTDHITTSWPGRTYCDASCGCWGCDCFYCVDGCLFSRFAIVPHNTTVFSVEEVVTLVRQPVLVYSMDVGSGVVSGVITMASQTVGDGTFSITVVGSLSENPTFFGSNKFIFNPATSETWYGSASDLDQPILGSIGDLQSDDANYPYIEDRSAFNFPFSSVQKSVGTNKATFTSVSNGARLISNLPKLPYTVGTYHIYNSGGTLEAIQTAPAPVIVNIISFNAIHMVRYLTDTCPEMSFINGTGCYSCGTPATVFVKARATCVPGYVGLYVLAGEGKNPIQLATTSIYLTSYEEILPVNMLVTEEDVQASLCIDLPGDNAFCITIEFTAMEKVDTADDELVDPVIIEPDQPEGYKLDFLAGLGLPRWLSCTLDVLIIIAGLIIAVLIIYLLVKLVIAIRMSRKKKIQ